jgi:UDP-glucuronate 4-epimerase
MKILVTGVAGFIGFHVTEELLKNKNYKIIGIDNLDSYYSVSLKKKRLSILKKKSNFKFKKYNIINCKHIQRLHKNNFDYIFHFAAQAGVRNVVHEPKKYIDVNISGFFNILQLVLNNKPKKFFYASSSSVYGDSKNYPSKEIHDMNPKNIYGLSKKFNEELVKIYSQNIPTKFIGLRFFTVFGEWGRPDMLLISFFIKVKKRLQFSIHNYGNHVRDFTYIYDAVRVVKRLFIIKNLPKHIILNICSSKPIRLKLVIKKLKNLTNYNFFKYTKYNKAEVIKTYGSNKKLLKLIGNFKFTNFNEGLKNTYSWFLKNTNYLIKK